MKICSENDYRQLIEGISDLCCEGFVSTEYCKMFNINYESSRTQLLNAYQEFVTCCSWLSECRFNDYATHFSPDSMRIKSKIDTNSGRLVSNGSLIAAVMYLDLPHVTLGNSPNIAIAISRFCTRFHASAESSA